MEFNKCSRCGNFFISNDDVCPKCKAKDNLEFQTLKTYIEENGMNENLDVLSSQTGITVKNLNRFLDYTDFKNLPNESNNVKL